MNYLFYISSIVAIAATVMVITRHQPVHALLYLVVSFLGVAMIFLSLGAPFVATLEIILYAGAIIVLFIFVVMMLNLGRESAIQEKQWMQPKTWIGPSILTVILLAELLLLIVMGGSTTIPQQTVDLKKIPLSLYGEYIIAVELTGFLLMAGIVGAAHIGRHKKKYLHRFLKQEEDAVHFSSKT
ncbi:NADH-quinone oxidoreductase subunit J [Pinibacter soli]|uniref:NADH-quinone oxidoreductase subunit J n=1 Tax=Pinibacter soli TaxID=3044211 RepID=A0ABT6RES5_9BACT|nr:NADH-quinone oxidoreductase subunit J [Pinibacter soli]MDI3320971.1 NADH-quinone oxidoreductase subunit J [Pinibacter soli]